MPAIYGSPTELEMYAAEGREIVAALREHDIAPRSDTANQIILFESLTNGQIPTDPLLFEEMISTVAHLVTSLRLKLESLTKGNDNG